MRLVSSEGRIHISDSVLTVTESPQNCVHCKFGQHSPGADLGKITILNSYLHLGKWKQNESKIFSTQFSKSMQW